MNKTMKKVLSVILCVIMIFSTSAFAFAADGSFAYSPKYFQKTSTQAQNAAIVLDKLDEVLKEQNIKETIDLKVTKIVIDLTSINGLCKTVDTFKDLMGNGVIWLTAKALLGDIGDLDLKVWQKGMKRGTQDVQILNELLELLGTNAKIISKIIDNSIDLGVLKNSVNLSDILGPNGVNGLIKELLVGLVYKDENSQEYKNAVGKKLDNFIFEDVFALFNKEDGALPGFSMNANSTVDNILLSAFASAWNKYLVGLIQGINIDLKAQENEALQKLGDIINLDGSKFDPNTVKIDLSKSFESQINNILGSVVKFFYPSANWTEGGKDKIAGNFEALYKDLAKAMKVEANPLAIVKYVLSNIDDASVKEYVGDFQKWTSMKQAVAAVLLNTAKKEGITVKSSTNYETILGDYLTYGVQDYIDLGYKAGAGKNIWTVLNDIANIFLIDKGFASALNIKTAKTDSIFVKIDKVLDMTGTKFANYSSEDFVKGIIDSAFNFDFAAAIDKTVITFLNDYSNEKAINVMYDAVYTVLKNCFGKQIIVPRATATPIENAISNASLKSTVENILTAINSGKAKLLPPVLYVGALAIGQTVIGEAKIPDQVYTGKPIVPSTVTLGGKTLKLGTDYTAQCSNNVDFGTAKAVLTGIGQYKDTIETTFKIVLGKPASLKATVGTTSANLTWTAVAGAASYQVSCNGKTQTVTTNKATVSGLTSGKSYTATVKAISKSGSASSSVSFTTALAQVTSVKVVPAATSAKVTWKAVPNATSYEVQSSKDGKTWSKAVTSKTTSATVSSLSAYTNYQFRVRAIAKNTSGAYSTVVKAKTLLATVTGLKAKATTTSLELTWTKVAGASGYTVQYSLDGKKWTAKNVSTNKLVLSKLPNNTNYQVKVCAYDKSKVAGAYSSVLKTKTLLPKVAGIKVTAAASSLKVTWSKVSGATSYEVYYSKDGKKWSKVTVKTNSATISKLSANTTYYVMVKAYKGKVLLAQSDNVKTATLLAAPTSLKTSRVTKNSLRLSWKKVSGAAGYEVYRNGKKVATLKGGKTDTFNDKKLAKNTTYKYSVKAYKVVSGKNVYGASSSTISVKTKK